MSIPKPPAQIEAYVRVLGVDGALEFLMAFGGAELALSMAPRRSKLVEVVGVDAATALAAEDARVGLPRRVPLAKPWCAKVLRERGLSVADIARKMHASDVAVRRWLKLQHNSRAADPRQASLF